ncbi:MAG: YcbK family protein [Deltaproteobacteria bacterium]|nr:YcbK family protein [Deltaproteobacteria bacterium]
MWSSIRLPALLVAALGLILLLDPPVHAQEAEDVGAQAAEPAARSYYGRRHDPECRMGSASPEYLLKMAKLRIPDESLAEPRWVGPYRELRLHALHGGERISVVPFDEQGEVTAEAAEQIRSIFCGTRRRCEASVDPRLVRLLYVIAFHFEAREIVVVSGIRLPEEDGRTSNHHVGRAVDLIVPGVPNEEVAAYAREFGRVGVGYYPVSGFVHLDVRDRSFFWRDPSGPGETNCTQAILPDVAREVDELYDARFEDPRTWAPVPLPPDPEDPEARPERRADRLDELDDEAAVAAIFDGQLRDELRVAEREVSAAATRRAAAARRRAERAERQAAAAQPAARDTAVVAGTPAEATAERRNGDSGETQASADAGPQAAAAQDSSNTSSPPTTVATALPGTS